MQSSRTAWLVDNGIHPTDDSFKYKSDVELLGTVIELFSTEGFLMGGTFAEKGDRVGLILDKSSFYAETGGQDADVGTINILSEGGDVVGSFTVIDVQSYGGYILQSGIVEDGMLEVGSVIKCKVDYDPRRLVAPNAAL